MQQPADGAPAPTSNSPVGAAAEVAAVTPAAAGGATLDYAPPGTPPPTESFGVRSARGRIPLPAMQLASSVLSLAAQLRWRAVAWLQLIQPVVTSIGAIIMAALGCGVYSLVVPPILADGLRGFEAWRLAGGHIDFRPRLAVVAEIVHSTLFIVLAN